MDFDIHPARTGAESVSCLALAFSRHFVVDKVTRLPPLAHVEEKALPNYVKLPLVLSLL